MSWNGSGVVVRSDGTRSGATVWAQAKAAGVKIKATDHDTHDEDLASAIEACLNLDGENSPNANIPWGSNKITGLAAGDAAGDALAYGQSSVRLDSTDVGAAAAPLLDLYRNSSSPANDDALGELRFSGEDSAGNKQTFASIHAEISDVTSTSEDGRLLFTIPVAGTDRTTFRIGGGGTARLTSYEDGAAQAPTLTLHRNSTSPADDDVLGGIEFDGEDSSDNQQTYGRINAIALDVTSATEEGTLAVSAVVAGTITEVFRAGCQEAGSTTVVLDMLGNEVVLDADNDTSIHASTDDQIDFKCGGVDVVRFDATGIAVSDGGATLAAALARFDTGSDILIGDFSATSGTFNTAVVRLGADRTANSAYDFLDAISDRNQTPDQEFALRGDGNAFADGSFSGSGAGYAEMFEWADGNPGNEDRVGYTVALDGDKIRKAESGDEVIGVITGRPTVVGNGAPLKWNNRYERDKFGRRVLDAEGGRKPSPDFDPEQEYTSRRERSEWGCVSLLGQEYVREGQLVDPRWRRMTPPREGVALWLVR